MASFIREKGTADEIRLNIPLMEMRSDIYTANKEKKQTEAESEACLWGVSSDWCQ